MDLEYYKIVRDILENKEFQKRKNYSHHGNITVYDHSLNVSLLAYKIANKFKSIDSKKVAIAGLLHDFYYEPWQTNTKKRKLLEKHGFVHAKEALDNSIRHFDYLLDDKTKNAILRHMFPLNKIPPKYKESWIVTLADKLVSLEVILHPTFFLYLFCRKGDF